MWCFINDVILPGEIREILNQVVAAEKRAQANLIHRREETAATRSLLNTARLMEESPILIRLKALETLEKLTEKGGGHGHRRIRGNAQKAPARPRRSNHASNAQKTKGQ